MPIVPSASRHSEEKLTPALFTSTSSLSCLVMNDFANAHTLCWSVRSSCGPTVTLPTPAAIAPVAIDAPERVAVGLDVVEPEFESADEVAWAAPVRAAMSAAALSAAAVLRHASTTWKPYRASSAAVSLRFQRSFEQAATA